MINWINIADEYKALNDMLRDMLKERNKKISYLTERVQELEEENKRYLLSINAMQQIFKDAIYSLDAGEKVQGLERGVKLASEALEADQDEAQ